MMAAPREAINANAQMQRAMLDEAQNGPQSQELKQAEADYAAAKAEFGLNPRTDIGKGTSPIDAGISPEIDQGDFSAQVYPR